MFGKTTMSLKGKTGIGKFDVLIMSSRFFTSTYDGKTKKFKLGALEIELFHFFLTESLENFLAKSVNSPFFMSSLIFLIKTM
jgi:hypothetical protein